MRPKGSGFSQGSQRTSNRRRRTARLPRSTVSSTNDGDGDISDDDGDGDDDDDDGFDGDFLFLDDDGDGFDDDGWDILFWFFGSVCLSEEFNFLLCFDG